MSTSDAAAFGTALRPLFQLEGGAVYLNHGSYGAAPRSVTDAQHRWQARMEAEPNRFMAREFRPALRAAADRLAPYLGEISGEEIALVENATGAVNAVLRSIDWHPGDEILITNQTYGAVRNTVHYVAKRTGAVPVEVALPFPARSVEAVIDAFVSGLSSRTRLAIIDHVTSPTALVLPVEPMVQMARAAGALVLVDGAHAPGMVPVDLTRIGADAYTGNCHKWLFAARGCGFLWANEGMRELVHPTVISHGWNQGFAAEFDWVGTRDASAQHALPAALDFVDRFGLSRMRTHNHALARAAGERLAARWGTETGATDALIGAMVMVRLPDGFGASVEDAHILRERLVDDDRVQVPINALAGGLWARVSSQIYNTIEEIDILADAVLAKRPNQS
ncbi:MAG: aminotransferase class V-fold PLP-dependent enzyme [Alphaproteobacteria bacterium]|nr:aminotransferase class V-fold PLP-dependent enzyme [Alphaproteobacteria bacterium]